MSLNSFVKNKREENIVLTEKMTTFNQDGTKYFKIGSWKLVIGRSVLKWAEVGGTLTFGVRCSIFDIRF